jgi:thiamine kinase-like enzyme
MPPGKSSLFLNRIDIWNDGVPETRWVEKAVRNDSGELSFWCGSTWPDPILTAESYNAVSPIDLHIGDTLSVLYFPYVPALDREKKILQREFRSKLKAIAGAVADFNGHNMGKSDAETRRGGRFEAARPTRSDLEARLGIAGDDASALLRSWDQAYAAWQASRATLARLPWCLCHNDVSPGNSIYNDGVLALADFGLACGGPVGSDLHTLIRRSGNAIANPVHVEGLLRAYVSRIRAYDESISLADVRLAAWATFFLRYTNLKFSSARYPNILSLAIQRMIEVGRIESAPAR